MNPNNYTPKSVQTKYEKQQLHEKLDLLYRALGENKLLDETVKRNCISTFEQMRKLIEGGENESDTR